MRSGQGCSFGTCLSWFASRIFTATQSRMLFIVLFGYLVLEITANFYVFLASLSTIKIFPLILFAVIRPHCHFLLNLSG